MLRRASATELRPRYGSATRLVAALAWSQARTGQYVDLIKDGVIDPTKVVRTALQNAASVAGMMLTTEAMIAEKPKKESHAPAGGGGGGMGGMGGMDM